MVMKVGIINSVYFTVFHRGSISPYKQQALFVIPINFFKKSHLIIGVYFSFHVSPFVSYTLWYIIEL